MNVSIEELEILNHLVGTLDENMAVMMKQKIDFFLNPRVSLFIPSSGQCEYAIKSNHTHPSYTFIYYFQSVNNFVVEGKKLSYDLLDGKCMTAMSPEIPHEEIQEDYYQSYIAIAVEKEFFDEIMLKYTTRLVTFRGEIFSPHPELLGLLRCFMLEAGDNSEKNMQLLDCLATSITHYLVRSLVSEVSRTIKLYDRFEVDRAIAYMNSHFSEKITLEELAEVVNLSSGHFAKVFRSVTGETPIDFLNMLRLRKARNMLVKGKGNMTEIAMECGFRSSSYFSSCFLEKYKTTPSAYRQNFLKSDISYDFNKS